MLASPATYTSHTYLNVYFYPGRVFFTNLKIGLCSPANRLPIYPEAVCKPVEGT
jgi:hypothetical protein